MTPHPYRRLLDPDDGTDAQVLISELLELCESGATDPATLDALGHALFAGAVARRWPKSAPDKEIEEAVRRAVGADRPDSPFDPAEAVAMVRAALGGPVAAVPIDHAVATKLMIAIGLSESMTPAEVDELFERAELASHTRPGD